MLLKVISCKKLISFVLLMWCGYSEAMDLLPKAQLDSAVLNYYYPQILEEIEKEFAHQDDGRTRRDTREYGYSFFKMENGDFSYTAPPAFFNELGNKVCESLGHPHKEFTNIILSFYGTGFYLEPHIDINASDYPNSNFFFDDQVYGLIIEADTTGCLYLTCDATQSTPPLCSLEEKPGVVFCLQGDYRKFPYFHGVSTVSKRRISITFRETIIPLDQSNVIQN